MLVASCAGEGEPTQGDVAAVPAVGNSTSMVGRDGQGERPPQQQRCVQCHHVGTGDRALWCVLADPSRSALDESEGLVDRKVCAQGDQQHGAGRDTARTGEESSRVVDGFGVGLSAHPDFDVVGAVAVDLVEAEPLVQGAGSGVDGQDVQLDGLAALGGLLQ